MSIIAVEGLNNQISLIQVSEMLGKCIKGPFEPLNFVNSDHSPVKTCYLKLSDKLDPVEVIERINNAAHGKKKTLLNAYIPHDVPNLPVAPVKVQKLLLEEEGQNNHAVSTATNELLAELQYKYTGLYNLSKKGSHSLLEAIAMTIRSRLLELLLSDKEASNPFVMTARYHRAHPHAGDWQLIVGTLHRLQDAAGAPRTELKESELVDVPNDVNVGSNMPYTEASKAVTKYQEKIMKKLEEHVGGYDLTSNPEDSTEEAARKKVQAQIAKMMQYMPAIMSQVVQSHFLKDNNKKYRSYKMRVYGQPHLPSAELTATFLRGAGALHVTRSKTTHNLLLFDVPLDKYRALVAKDGTSLGGCNLVIRSSSVPIFRFKQRAGQTDAEDEDAEEPMEQ